MQDNNHSNNDQSFLLLPQRRLACNGNEKGLIDVDSIEGVFDKSSILPPKTIKRHDVAAFTNRLITPKRFNKEGRVDFLAVCEDLKIITCIYGFLTYEDIGVHSRINRSFCKLLKQVDISVSYKCHGNSSDGSGLSLFSHHLKYRSHPMLNLISLKLGDDDAQIRSKELTNICTVLSNGRLPNLKSIHVQIHVDADESGVVNLMDALIAYPNKLTTLDIAGCYVGTTSMMKVSEILANKKLEGVERFNVNRNGLGEQGVKYLVNVINGGCFSKLKHLHLSRNGIKHGFVMLCKSLSKRNKKSTSYSPLNTTLESLDVSYNEISSSDISTAYLALRGSCNSHSLKSIDCSCNDLGDEGSARLCEILCAHDTKFEAIKLINVDAEYLFICALANVIRGDKLRCLIKLDISKNVIGKQGAEKLMEAGCVGKLEKLEMLNISTCNLGDGGVNAVCLGIRREDLETLKELDISANSAPASMVHLATLLKAGSCGSLSLLNVKGNGGVLDRVFRDLSVRGRRKGGGVIIVTK